MQVALDGFVVAARAADPGSPSPSHRLAEWIRELFPEGEDPGAQGSIDLPAAPVVTFLDDGEAKVVEGVASEGGDRSALETAADSAHLSLPSPRPRRWPWLLLAAAALAGGAFAAVRLTPTPAPAPAPAPVAAPAPVPDAAPVPDPDAAPAPVPDAAPAPVVVVKQRPPGTVRINTTPWSRVTVVGQKAGCEETECTLTLPPGRYTLRLHNPIDPTRSKNVKIEVKSGEETLVQETL
jgi:hypothetical protein